jgi:hypothetical protein
MGFFSKDIKTMNDLFVAGADCACECYSVIRAETDKLMGAAKFETGA